MLTFGDFFKTQSDQTHQNEPYFKNFLRVASICP